MKLVCINTTHPSGLIDPYLTIGQVYTVQSIVHTMAGEPMVSILNDEGEEIERPRHLFITLSQHQEWKRRQKNTIQKSKVRGSIFKFFTKKGK